MFRPLTLDITMKRNDWAIYEDKMGMEMNYISISLSLFKGGENVLTFFDGTRHF